jgi:hypothetical protein
MQPIFQAISSFFKKLGGQPVGDLHKTQERKRSEKSSSRTEARPPQPAVDLTTLNEEQLRTTVPELSERALIRQLQAMEDPARQLKVIQYINSEATLKRILRSELNKKLKKAAESRLQETEGNTTKKRHEQASKLCDELEAFLRNPDWQKGPALLAKTQMHTPVAQEGSRPSGLSQSLHDRFSSLKNRLESGLASFEKTLAEMADIAKKLSPENPLSRGDLKSLQDRWRALTERYPFDQELPVFTIYRDHVRLRAEDRSKKDRTPHRKDPQSQGALPPSSPLTVENSSAELPTAPPTEQPPLGIDSKPQENLSADSENQKAPHREKKREWTQAERSAHLEEIQKDIQGIEKNLTARQSGDRLKERQKQLFKLERWKNEFPELLEELKNRVQELLIKRTHQLSESQWDLWARTDQATRILQTLQARLDSLEQEPDPKKRVLDSRGLSQQILTGLSDLKALGHLDREKDHQIWEEFKTQTERGWRFCELQRQQILDAFRATLLETLQTPKELSLQSVQDPAFVLDFKPEAFQEDIATLLKELRLLWTEVGARRSQANSEADFLITRLFERYFRAFNLHHGQIQRTQQQLETEKKRKLEEVRALLQAELKLSEKVKKAVQISQSWTKSPFPESQKQSLQEEFVAEMARLMEGLSEKMVEQLRLTEVTLQAALSPVAQQDASAAQSENSPQQPSPSALRATLEDLTQKRLELDSLIQILPQILKLRAEQPADALPKLPFDESSLQETRLRIQAGFDSMNRAIQVAAQERQQARDQLLAEVESLALSTDWEQTQARLTELTDLWKKARVLQTPEDSSYTLLFDNAAALFQARAAASASNPDATASTQDSKRSLQTQKGLLFRLDALARFRETKKGETPSFSSLDQVFKEEDPSQVTSKVLEAGLSYRSVLSMEPKTGLLKETKKLMEEWVRAGLPADSQASLLYRAYLERLHWIFGINQAE